MLMELLTNIGVLAGSGIGVFAATAAVKKIKAIPVNEGQTTRVRSVAAVLSVVATGLVAFSNGDLKPDTLQEIVVAIANAGTIWLTAHASHVVVKGDDKE